MCVWRGCGWGWGDCGGGPGESASGGSSPALSTPNSVPPTPLAPPPSTSVFACKGDTAHSCRSEDNLSPLWCESMTHFLPAPLPPHPLPVSPQLPLCLLLLPPTRPPCPLFAECGGVHREHSASGLNSSIPMCIHILIDFFHSEHMLLLLLPPQPPAPTPTPLAT